MNELIVLFGVLGSLAAVLVSIALWAPRRLWVKLGALGIAAVFLPAGYFGLSEMLSRPKPVSLELARQELAEATVLGAHLQEDEAIHLWLGLPGVAEPRAYSLPWDRRLARQLRGVERESEESGAPVQIRKPFESSMDDREQRFYAAPPPPPPEKERPAENPLDFQGTPPAGQDGTN